MVGGLARPCGQPACCFDVHTLPACSPPDGEISHAREIALDTVPPDVPLVYFRTPGRGDVERQVSFKANAWWISQHLRNANTWGLRRQRLLHIVRSVKP